MGASRCLGSTPKQFEDALSFLGIHIDMHYDTDENMAVIHKMPADSLHADLHAVTLLVETQVFVLGLISAPDGLYSPDLYLFQHRVQEIEFVIPPDRNEASRMARAGLGELADKDRRLAAQ